MCDPVTAIIAGGALVGSTAYSARQARKASTEAAKIQADAQPDPAAERAKAEAEAAQRVNAQLAADGRRRREQGSLISRGAPALQLGDEGEATGTGASPLGAPGSGGRLTSRRTVAQTASLMSRGAPAGGGYGGGGGGRGGFDQVNAV
jgi:hypothetical protein